MEKKFYMVRRLDNGVWVSGLLHYFNISDRLTNRDELLSHYEPIFKWLIDNDITPVRMVPIVDRMNYDTGDTRWIGHGFEFVDTADAIAFKLAWRQ